MSEPTVSSVKGTLIVAAVVVAAILVLYIGIKVYGIGEGVLGGIGLTSTDRDKKIAAEEQQMQKSGFSSPNWYMSPPTGKQASLLLPSTIDLITHDIADSGGSWQTDGSRIKASIEKMRNKAQFSMLVRYFSLNYHQSLTTFLKEQLNPATPEAVSAVFNDQRKQMYLDILTYLNDLPAGWITKK